MGIRGEFLKVGPLELGHVAKTFQISLSSAHSCSRYLSLSFLLFCLISRQVHTNGKAELAALQLATAKRIGAGKSQSPIVAAVDSPAWRKKLKV